VIAVTLCSLILAMAALKFGTSSEAFSSSPVRDADIVSNKVAPEVLADTAGGDQASVVIYLADQADVSAAYDMKDQDARGWYVYNTLSEHAARTQTPIKAMLDAEGIQYQSFWAANMIVADADRSLVERLAIRADVARVDPNRPAYWIEKPELANRRDVDEKDEPYTTEWGVNNVNAPAVWAMGFNGQGIVVGDLDTGERWTHNALRPKYRGWNGSSANHNYNWHDAIHSGGGSCGANTQAPCDDSGHGTHTAGTMVGDDGAGNQVGVAPGARWIGCRNMNVGVGTPATYTECFQFTIAPTDLAGNNPDPTLRPHVLNNSWGCPTSEGCTTRAELETIINNTQAAGIFVEASAGNAGSGCSSVQDPPAIYSASFSTGAIDIGNNLAGFSSRGPSTFYSPSLLKPNISAPGVNVRSSYSTSDTSYTGLQGTSMAGPHVCGVVALLWSARPQLARDIAATKAVLQNTANPNVNLTPVQTCGGTPSTQIPNNSFGYGRVDALAAVNAVPFATPTPTPTISPGITPTPIPTPTPTITPTPTPTPCVGNYIISQIGGSIVPGTTDIGNHQDDGVTTVALPFPYQVYEQTFTSVSLSSNGNAQFTTTDTTFTNQCLPWPAHNYTIFPYWDDLYLVNSGFGIFTSVTGTAPNRIFNIEWRAQYFPGSGTANFELRLYESQSRFDVIYSTVTNANTTATSGVQKNDTTFIQYFCDGSGGVAAGAQSYILQGCGTPTPTPVATPTPTPTRTPTPTPPATPTPTPIATPTPTPNCTPSTQRIADGTFETGPPWPLWTVQTSTNFGTPLCDVASCGDGFGQARPYTGINWAWFGGAAAAENATLGQTYIVPTAGPATLTFQMWIGGVSFPFTDTLTVSVDGNVVQTFIEPGAAEAGYSLRSIPVNFVTTGSHTVLFTYHGPTADVANFNVDNISLLAGGTCVVPRSRADFDGDGRTDVSVFRPSEGNWYLQRSTAGFAALTWGISTDKLVPGDYDGDGKTDVAIFRADADPANSDFYILNSSNGTVSGLSWGVPGDIPMAGDYDGDGRTDVAVYRPSDNTWYIIRSTAGFISARFGAPGDVPLLMDPNASSNLAVYRPGNNTWYIAATLVDPAHHFNAIPWGQAGDMLVPADYDGDDRDDIAVFRPSNGTWYVRRSSGGTLFASQWGTNGDVPVPGDYDGDGRDDLAVYRGGTWYLNRSTAGFSGVQFGVASDVPVPKAYIP